MLVDSCPARGGFLFVCAVEPTKWLQILARPPPRLSGREFIRARWVVRRRFKEQKKADRCLHHLPPESASPLSPPL
jgi:hypothetical protein